MAQILPLPSGELFQRERFNVADADMDVWDKGVFLNELQRQGIVFSHDPNAPNLVARQPLEKGTFHGTTMALTELYSLLEDSASSHFDTAKIEPIIPIQRDLDEKRKEFTWSDGSDRLPPHLSTKPKDEDLFNQQLAGLVNGISLAFSFIIPQKISDAAGTPYLGPTIADCEDYNGKQKDDNTDIMPGRNLADYPDWYSDARFAQQHFSGVNPTTIEVATADQVKPYIAEANKQGLSAMEKILSEGKELLIQDYSYFRKATNVPNEQDFMSVVIDPTNQNKVARYACASVVIFQLHEDGRIHPLAITLDHKGSLEQSITIFNRRLNPDDKGDMDEKLDWPWRYAKTCAQTADWARHEIAVHLVDTHMIEEAIIVATNRTVPETHLLYELLSPHWFRTLALNFAARQLMVPFVVCRLAGFGPSMQKETSRVMDFATWSYKNFDFQGKYVPNDLKKRGFDMEDGLKPKYRNYPYATIMYHLWGYIRKFVKGVLETQYKSDADVTGDKYIADWCKEIQGPGQITSFPTITTVDQLIDACTMCIHTASTEHTAVNYLQEYYYGFIPSKPAALCAPLPKDLKTLQSYTEKELTAALPIGADGPKWKDWLLSALLPKLLSYKVEGRYNLITYAKSLYNVNKERTNFERKEYNTDAIKKAAGEFYEDLMYADKWCDKISDAQTKGSVPYPVLKPELTAVSILI